MRRINSYPFNCGYTDARAHDRYIKLKGKIEEEKNNPYADRNTILKLEQEKLMAGLFDSEPLGSAYAKYRSPY